MKDGLYVVLNQPAFVAGFVIENGEVAQCAPILRRRIAYWCKRARWVAP